MSNYKYPYIPDKRMYAAVMGACSWIRDSGCFNKAVRYYADKYNVDEEELAMHIRARQAAGQKGKTAASKGRKYKYFLVCETVWCEANGETQYYNPAVVKGLTAKSVVKRYSEHDWNMTVRRDYGGVYAPEYGHEVIGEYATQAEAEEALRQYLTADENGL